MLTPKRFQQLRVIVTLFILCIVALAVYNGNFLLSLVGVVTGMLFLIIARVKIHRRTDERELSVQQKAAQFTYAIFTPTLGLTAILLLIPSKSGLSVFSKGEFAFTEALGMIFAYLSLMLIVTYSIAHFFINQKLGGSIHEK